MSGRSKEVQCDCDRPGAPAARLTARREPEVDRRRRSRRPYRPPRLRRSRGLSGASQAGSPADRPPRRPSRPGCRSRSSRSGSSRWRRRDDLAGAGAAASAPASDRGRRWPSASTAATSPPPRGPVRRGGRSARRRALPVSGARRTPRARNGRRQGCVSRLWRSGRGQPPARGRRAVCFVCSSKLGGAELDED